MIGRCMYIWYLAPVIKAEGSVAAVVAKAKRAGIANLWVKVADGGTPFANVTGTMAKTTSDLVGEAKDAGIAVWGWQVPHCPTQDAARNEAALLARLVSDFALKGAIMDAEGGSTYFQGGVAEAELYSSSLKSQLKDADKSLGLSSNDIPQNFPGFPPKFAAIAAQADFNFPQVYYGASPSVQNRLNRAAAANAHVAAPFVPVGAAFLGVDDGGCSSASACAERAREFLRLCAERKYQGHSFWHWAGAPLAFWNVLFDTPA